MTLREKLNAVYALEGKTRIRVYLIDGREISGLFMEYGFADDNEEGVNSIDIEVRKNEPYYWLREDEVKAIEAI